MIIYSNLLLLKHLLPLSLFVFVKQRGAQFEKIFSLRLTTTSFVRTSQRETVVDVEEHSVDELCVET